MDVVSVLGNNDDLSICCCKWKCQLLSRIRNCLGVYKPISLYFLASSWSWSKRRDTYAANMLMENVFTSAVEKKVGQVRGCYWFKTSSQYVTQKLAEYFLHLFRSIYCWVCGLRCQNFAIAFTFSCSGLVFLKRKFPWRKTTWIVNKYFFLDAFWFLFSNCSFGWWTTCYSQVQRKRNVRVWSFGFSILLCGN